MKKIMMLRYKATLLFYFLVASCSDVKEELSGSFFYFNEGGTNKAIISHLPKQEGVYGEILSYDYDKDHIIVLQRPVFSHHKEMLAFQLRSDPNVYPENSNEEILKSERIADSILRTDPHYKRIFLRDSNYWIIVIKIDSVIGPLSIAEFEQARRKYNVDVDLELETLDQ